MSKSTLLSSKNKGLKIFSFILHVWREQADTNRFVLRGSLTNVQSGEKRYFQSVSDLGKVIVQAVDTNLKEEGGASKTIEKKDKA